MGAGHSSPASGTTIGCYVFSWCSSLTSVTILSDVTTIGEDAFSNCPSLALIIPSSVIEMGDMDLGSESGRITLIKGVGWDDIPAGLSIRFDLMGLVDWKMGERRMFMEVDGWSDFGRLEGLCSIYDDKF